MPIYHNYCVKLYKNNLTKDNNTYYARPVAERTLSLEDIARSAANRGGATMTARQIVTAVEEYFAEAYFAMMDGFSINNGYDITYLTMEGKFNGPHDTYDPERHKLKICIVPTERANKELQNVIVDIQGVAKVGPQITRVIDLSSGNINQTLKPGSCITIEGRRLKITGTNDSCGIHLLNTDDNTAIHLSGNDIYCNEPRRLMAQLPHDLTTGTYRLSITTQYCDPKCNVKSPRTVTFEHTLTVE